MVKVNATEQLDLEQIKSRLLELQALVNQLKSQAVVRAKSLELIHQERLFLQQQLLELKIMLEHARAQSTPTASESRVIN